MFDPIKPSKVSQEIINQIVTAIQQGKLGRGDKLPSERELAKTFHVSRQMVREAIGALVALGVLEAQHGGGTFVKRETVSNLEQNLSALLEDKQESIYQLLEVRKEMEGKCAYLAAQYADEEDLNTLAMIIGEMEEQVKANVVKSEQIDMEFHLAVAQATHNQVRAEIYNAIFHLLRDVHRLARKKLYEANQVKLLVQHQAIYEAIKARNPQDAQEKMLEHLNFVEEELRKLENGSPLPVPISLSEKGI